MMKSSGQIIRRYATALFELSQEAGKLQEVRDQASVLVGAIDESVAEFFASPRFKESSKNEVIDALTAKMKLNDNLVKFLKLVVENGRAPVVKQVLASFLVRADAALGIARADIISATALEASEINKFKELLSTVLKKKVEIVHSVDPSLKAGSIIKLGNTIVDASLRTRLANLKDSLSVGV